ncbi:MAG TPA: hypothetical protein PKI71_04575 [Candidatus Rifleibacterium sp.]|nr:hypothetical protein [Candidatus Rifleibacterium sp.]
MSLLDSFDSVFAITFTCFLPPPYDTAFEVEEVIDAQIERVEHLKAIIRHNKRHNK